MIDGIPKVCFVDSGSMFGFCNYSRESEEHVADCKGKWITRSFRRNCIVYMHRRHVQW